MPVSAACQGGRRCRAGSLGVRQRFSEEERPAASWVSTLARRLPCILIKSDLHRLLKQTAFFPLRGVFLFFFPLNEMKATREEEGDGPAFLSI